MAGRFERHAERSVILVDSSVWIDYFKGAVTAQTEELDAVLGHQPLAIGDLMLTEVLQGFAKDETSMQPRIYSRRSW